MNRKKFRNLLGSLSSIVLTSGSVLTLTSCNNTPEKSKVFIKDDENENSKKIANEIKTSLENDLTIFYQGAKFTDVKTKIKNIIENISSSILDIKQYNDNIVIKFTPENGDLNPESLIKAKYNFEIQLAHKKEIKLNKIIKGSVTVKQEKPPKFNKDFLNNFEIKNINPELGEIDEINSNLENKIKENIKKGLKKQWFNSDKIEIMLEDNIKAEKAKASKHNVKFYLKVVNQEKSKKFNLDFKYYIKQDLSKLENIKDPVEIDARDLANVEPDEIKKNVGIKILTLVEKFDQSITKEMLQLIYTDDGIHNLTSKDLTIKKQEIKVKVQASDTGKAKLKNSKVMGVEIRRPITNDLSKIEENILKERIKVEVNEENDVEKEAFQDFFNKKIEKIIKYISNDMSLALGVDFKIMYYLSDKFRDQVGPTVSLDDNERKIFVRIRSLNEKLINEITTEILIFKE